MKDFFRGKGFKVLVITIVVLLGLAIYTASVGNSVIANIMGFVSSPMQNISANVTDTVTEFINLDGLSKSELKQLCGQLEKENAELTDKLVDYYNLQNQNEQLKTALGIKDENPDLELRPSTVIGRDPNDLFFGFSIDKGYLAGVTVGDPVITESGLVGSVSQVYATTSKVTSILSEDLQIPAVSKENGENGVVTSDIQLASSGVVKLSYLSNNTELKPGDLITTSGSGAAFPRDIVIGQVQSVEQSAVDISKYAIIKPKKDIKTITSVYVVTGFPGKDELPDRDDDPQNAGSSTAADDPEAIK